MVMLTTDFDVEKIRHDFPILKQEIHGKPLVYFDNAATTQKPMQVINEIISYYTTYNSNIHRGVHKLSQEATRRYEKARSIIKDFIHAQKFEEIVFTKGTTDAINLVASSFGNKYFEPGDNIIISAMEHHANIVPWQFLRDTKGIELRVIPMDDDGDLIFDEYEKLIDNRTKFVSVTHISNALGTINPIEFIIEKAHKKNIPVLIDGAQSIHHTKINVQDLDCDFFVFSGHKIYGPTGIGVLYAKEKHLLNMPPYQGGGDMIRSVTFEETLYNDLPYKFEAGTPNIEGGIVLAEAIKYLQNIGMDNIINYEHSLLAYAHTKLSEIEELKVIGTAKKRASLVSFVLDCAHPHDIGTMLDYEGVAVRTGHHCAEPVMRRFKVPATTRASFAFYNTHSEIDVLINSLKKVIKMFK